MIDFFKKFLKPKEESIHLFAVKKWLDENTDELQNVKEKIEEIKSLKSEIVENLKILEEVDISKSKVEDRVKVVVKGNLPAYTNAINLFLRKVSPPEEINYVNLDIFCDSFESEFKDLNKRTFRNFQIIKELVGKELENVAKGIKKLEVLVGEIRKYSNNIKNIAEMKEKADFIRDSIKNKEKNKIKRKELKKEKEKLVESCERLKKDIEKLKNGEKAKSLESLKQKEQKVSYSLHELDNQLLTLFSPLQKALKKYNNMCFIKKVDSYIENPVETLLKDSDLEILKFLQDIKKMVEEDKIDLKDDKKKKTLESLEKLDGSFFRKFIEDRNSLKEKCVTIQDEIKANTVLEEIKDLEKELNINSFKIEGVNREIERIKDVDIEFEVSELEKRLSKIFGHKIKIENVVGSKI